MIKEKKFNCCGCSACTVICPKQCLKMDINNEGFYEPIICNDKCINCDLCDKVCPELNRINEYDGHVKSVSAVSKDKNIYDSCSSGGIAFELSKLLLNSGYKICAVKYNYIKDIAEHYIVSNIDELNESKGSKYIQSFTEDAFKELFNGDKFVVIGTPCQISGIKKVAKLKKVENKFIFIDFFCHGVPSQYVWTNYLNYMKKINKINKISKLKFRDKKNGWHSFTISIKSNRNIIYSDKDLNNDMFYQFFLGNHTLNKCCYGCNYRLNVSEADIRIGDMWGEKYKFNNDGVSGVLIFNDKGINLINSLKNNVNITEENYNDVVEGQMHHSINEPIYREKLINDMKYNKNIRYLYYKYIMISKIKRRVNIIKGK